MLANRVEGQAKVWDLEGILVKGQLSFELKSFHDMTVDRNKVFVSK